MLTSWPGRTTDSAIGGTAAGGGRAGSRKRGSGSEIIPLGNLVHDRRKNCCCIWSEALQEHSTTFFPSQCHRVQRTLSQRARRETRGIISAATRVTLGVSAPRRGVISGPCSHTKKLLWAGLYLLRARSSLGSPGRFFLGRKVRRIIPAEREGDWEPRSLQSVVKRRPASVSP